MQKIEVLSVGHCCMPKIGYSFYMAEMRITAGAEHSDANALKLQPAEAEQVIFFNSALPEALAFGSHQGREGAGPYQSALLAQAQIGMGALALLDPNLPNLMLTEDIFHFNHKIIFKDQQQAGAAIRARNEHLDRMHNLGLLLAKEMTEQTLPEGTLSEPIFCTTQDGLRYNNVIDRASVTASFRMVFGSITGWRPSEDALFDSLQQATQKTKVHPRQLPPYMYMNVFHTSAFRQTFRHIVDPANHPHARRINTYHIQGAGFSTIGRIANIAARVPDASTYCLATLGTESKHNKSNFYTRTIALVGVDADTVTYHDPLAFRGDGRKAAMSRENFCRLWAPAFNEATVIVDIPLKTP